MTKVMFVIPTQMPSDPVIRAPNPAVEVPERNVSYKIGPCKKLVFFQKSMKAFSWLMELYSCN